MSKTQSTETPPTCPKCGRPVCTTLGIATEMLVDAIRLQAAGTEIVCSECGFTFILRGPDQDSVPEVAPKKVPDEHTAD